MRFHLPPSNADQASDANMRTPTSQRYKGRILASQWTSTSSASPLPPTHTLPTSPSSPPVPSELDSAVAIQTRHSPPFGSASQRPGLSLVSLPPPHRQPHRPKFLSISPSLSSPSSSSSATTRHKSSAAADLDQYDWTPIQLLTPPHSSHSKEISSLATTAQDTSGWFRSPHSEFPHRINRDAAWQSSPTLNTRRARKLSQNKPLSMSSDRSRAGSAPFDVASGTSPSRMLSYVVKSPSGSEVVQPSPSSPGAQQSEARRTEMRSMIPPIKPRALTLGSFDRPVLPPLFGHHYQSNLGPIRTSSRHRAGYRSNPFFVSTPVRKRNDYFALTPSSLREFRDHSVLSPYNGSRTPTSSMRSTSLGGHLPETRPSRSSASQTHIGAPLPVDKITPGGLRPGSNEPIQEHDNASLGLPSSHLAAPENALGLFVEPEPFPSELLHLDLEPILPSGLSPRSEADFFLGQGGGNFNFLNTNTKFAPRVFTRSPAIMSEASSVVPSPPNHGDDSLRRLSLSHRRDLNNSNTDPSLDLPALQIHDAAPAPGYAVSHPAVKPAESLKDDSFIYKMPILRAMSPLADMSSDSEEDSDEPLAGPSMVNRTSSFPGGTDVAETEQSELTLSQEGRTGEIFATPKTSLPLTLEHARSNMTEKLFCKLESTSHQCFSVVDGKWACYRRNYLKVDVAFHFEDEQGRRRDEVQGDLICEAGGRASFTVERFAVHMSAHVMSGDGRLQKGRQGLVPLIQFGPARERGPRETVQPIELRNGGRIVRDASANEQAATRSGIIAAFRRVQIRSATMNNGQRGAASQQFYALKLTLLAYPREVPVTVGGGIEVASLISHPITVRGRSKVHYASAGTGSVANKGGAGGTICRSLSAVPSANRKSAVGASSRRPSHARSRSMTTDQRRSSRLLLAVDRAASGESDEADEELEPRNSSAKSRTVSKVMDIRSII